MVAVPSSVFYEDPATGRHLVRFAFCKRTEVLTEAAERLGVPRSLTDRYGPAWMRRPAVRRGAARAASWASERFGGPVTVADATRNIAGGFDSFIHAVDLPATRFRLSGAAPLVVRMLPIADRAPQAAGRPRCRAGARDRGYAAPRVLAVLGPDDGFELPTQVMERAPGTTMLDAFSAKPWRARRLVDQLAGLALRLHALPTDGFPPDAATLVDHRLSLPRQVVAELDRPDLAAALDRRRSSAPRALDGPPVVCHGDFHPLNVMVDGERASVIDWTDAGLGPREADVARTSLLFHIAAIAARQRGGAGGAQGRRAAPVPPLPAHLRGRGAGSTRRACACGRCCTACTAGPRSRCCTPAASTARRAPSRTRSRSASATSSALASSGALATL